MRAYTQAELDMAARTLQNAADRCEKIQPKFQEGTAQYSLLRNRLRALYTAQKLLSGGQTADIPAAELRAALLPIRSIHHKTETAQRKYPVGTANYKRLSHTVQAAEIAINVLEQGLSREAEA